MVVTHVAMIERITSNTKGQQNHRCFEISVMNDINAKKRQAGKKKGKQSTMNGTGHRSSNTKCIPVYSEFHKMQK